MRSFVLLAFCFVSTLPKSQTLVAPKMMTPQEKAYLNWWNNDSGVVYIGVPDPIDGNSVDPRLERFSFITKPCKEIDSLIKGRLPGITNPTDLGNSFSIYRVKNHLSSKESTLYRIQASFINITIIKWTHSFYRDWEETTIWIISLNMNNLIQERS